ncbi:MAG: GDP-L-fucose synthase [Deltaproteobacteria bacterium]|nr:GDP-L-fucose synthase [Deltaproteobacteria bacterium]
MNKHSSIYIAGHRGLVGSAILRRLQAEGYTNLIHRTHRELDLTRQDKVEEFFNKERPEYVFLAAAKVGGIWANATRPAEFIYQNLAIQTNVLHAAYKAGIKRLLFLGSSCIYPRQCPQPMEEEHLLTGPLESTNQPYAVAKIAGIIQCEGYNRQYGTRFLAVMPTNLYGPNDNYDLENSHVLPALVRKFHLAKFAGKGDWEGIQRDETKYGPIPEDIHGCLLSISKHNGYDPPLPAANAILSDSAVILWGTGSPRREFLHVDDLADACLFLMNLPGDSFDSIISSDLSVSNPQRSDPQASSLPLINIGCGKDLTIRELASLVLPLINIGCGKDLTIRELASLVTEVVGYKGDVIWDQTKPDGTLRKLLDVSRLNGLCWEPRMSLREGIKTTYEWYLNQSA